MRLRRRPRRLEGDSPADGLRLTVGSGSAGPVAAPWLTPGGGCVGLQATRRTKARGGYAGSEAVHRPTDGIGWPRPCQRSRFRPLERRPAYGSVQPPPASESAGCQRPTPANCTGPDLPLRQPGRGPPAVGRSQMRRPRGSAEADGRMRLWRPGGGPPADGRWRRGRRGGAPPTDGRMRLH